ncbi:MAG TPA: DedA family protein [Stellaceae bacterium]|nr:DedA family protein [Stellaceae bacterium]
MTGWVQAVVAFIAEHHAWAGPIVGLIVFGQAIAVIGLVFPGSTVLVTAGGLVAAGALDYWTICAWTVPGAVLGDGISFWLGRRFTHRIGGWWPFRRRPAMLAQGIGFFRRHGGKSVFIGRFFGPVRATVALVAGMLDMPAGVFWIANIASAVVWVPLLLSPGLLLGFVYRAGIPADLTTDAAILLGALAILATVVAVMRHRRRRRSH